MNAYIAMFKEPETSEACEVPKVEDKTQPQITRITQMGICLPAYYPRHLRNLRPFWSP